MIDETQTGEMGAPPTFGDEIEIKTEKRYGRGCDGWVRAIVTGIFHDGASGYAASPVDSDGDRYQGSYNTWKHTFGVTWRWPAEGGRRSRVVSEDDSRQLEALRWCEEHDARVERRPGASPRTAWLVEIISPVTQSYCCAMKPTVAAAVDSLRSLGK